MGSTENDMEILGISWGSYLGILGIYLESKDSMDMVGYRKLRIWANHPQPSKKNRFQQDFKLIEATSSLRC